VKEIWSLQPRFDNRSGKRPFGLLDHPRLRAGYDFLALRAERGEAPGELAEWWRRFIEGTPEERTELLLPAAPDEKKRRRRRRGGGRRTPDQGPPPVQQAVRHPQQVQVGVELLRQAQQGPPRVVPVAIEQPVDGVAKRARPDGRVHVRERVTLREEAEGITKARAVVLGVLRVQACVGGPHFGGEHRVESRERGVQIR
jgi:hypothetical protein